VCVRFSLVSTLAGQVLQITTPHTVSLVNILNSSTCYFQGELLFVMAKLLYFFTSSHTAKYTCILYLFSKFFYMTTESGSTLLNTGRFCLYIFKQCKINKTIQRFHSVWFILLFFLVLFF